MESDSDKGDADMAAIMGFSSFSEVPKPKRRKVDTAEEHENTTSNIETKAFESVPSISFHNSIPIHTPGLLDSSTSYDQQSSTRRIPHQDNFRGQGPGRGRGDHHGNSKGNQPYYPSEETNGAHPVLFKTLESLDERDLYLLRGGVRDDRGRIVFFNRGMLDDDPWSKLRGHESREPRGEKNSDVEV